MSTNAFQSSSEPSLQKIAQNMNLTASKGHVTSGREAVRRMQKSRGLVFLGDKVTNKIDLVMEDQELEYMPEELWRSGFGVPLPKESPYTKHFSDM